MILLQYYRSGIRDVVCTAFGAWAEKHISNRDCWRHFEKSKPLLCYIYNAGVTSSLPTWMGSECSDFLTVRKMKRVTASSMLFIMFTSTCEWLQHTFQQFLQRN